MITVTIHSKDIINKVVTEGHANFAEYGKDIVCASVSAIGQGTVNALNKLTNAKPNFIVKDGYLEINFDKDEKSQLIAKTMIVQLKTIEESYKDYLKIIYS